MDYIHEIESEGVVYKIKDDSTMPIVQIDKDAFEALPVKDPNTLYIVDGDFEEIKDCNEEEY